MLLPQHHRGLRDVHRLQVRLRGEVPQEQVGALQPMREDRKTGGVLGGVREGFVLREGVPACGVLGRGGAGTQEDLGSHSRGDC